MERCECEWAASEARSSEGERNGESTREEEEAVRPRRKSTGWTDSVFALGRGLVTPQSGVRSERGTEGKQRREK